MEQKIVWMYGGKSGTKFAPTTAFLISITAESRFFLKRKQFIVGDVQLNNCHLAHKIMTLGHDATQFTISIHI